MKVKEYYTAPVPREIEVKNAYFTWLINKVNMDAIKCKMKEISIHVKYDNEEYHINNTRCQQCTKSASLQKNNEQEIKYKQQ